MIVGTTTNLALGVIVIVSDFLATAIPETLEATTKRLTHLTSKEGKKKKINRKTVVAPFAVDPSVGSSLSSSSSSDLSGPISAVISGAGGSPLDGPRMPGADQIAHELDDDDGLGPATPVENEKFIRLQKPARIVRKSTARKSEDLF